MYRPPNEYIRFNRPTVSCHLAKNIALSEQVMKSSLYKAPVFIKLCEN